MVRRACAQGCTCAGCHWSTRQAVGWVPCRSTSRRGRLVSVSSRSVDLSTALAVVAGRVPVSGGSVELAPPAGGSGGHASRVGYVGADHALVGTLTAVENVVVALLAATPEKPSPGGRRPGRGSRSATAELWRRAQDQLAALGLREKDTAAVCAVLESLNGIDRSQG